MFSPTEDWHKLYQEAVAKYEAHLVNLPGISGDKYRDYFEYLVLMDRGVQQRLTNAHFEGILESLQTNFDELADEYHRERLVSRVDWNYGKY